MRLLTLRMTTGVRSYGTRFLHMRSCNSLGTFSELYHDYLVSRLSDVSNDHYDLLDFV